MPVKKKLPVEDLRKSLEGILYPFAPIELKIKSGKIYLSEIMVKAISNSKSFVTQAEKNKIILPESTVNLARYGPVIEKIVNNNDDFMEIRSIKKRSQRKGAFFFEIPVWNARKIENDLKKSKKFKIKAKDDAKFFHENLIEFTSLINNPKKLFERFTSDFIEFTNFFTNPLTQIFTQITKGKNFFNELKTIELKKSSEEKEITNLRESITLNTKELKAIDEKLSEFWKEFYNTSTGGLFSRKEKEIQNLVRSDPLNHYLSIIKELIDTFDNFIQKQHIQVKDEQLTLIKKLNNSLIDPVNELSSQFQEFIKFYLVFSDDVFGKKLAKKPDFSDEKFLLSSPGWNAWLQEQQIANDLQELKSSDDYKEFTNKISELSKTKENLQSKLSEAGKKVNILEQNVEDYIQLKNQFQTQLIDWLKVQQK
ncbi:MAG: hypothetical protein HeimC3_18400 [Candidatus Heimdallarchaeota archaeon LC_3]|nr:MAG: hypothetical protein HeimC3_18400 [Candidatus Heimdallarchaeota archaeon LC_3]